LYSLRGESGVVQDEIRNDELNKIDKYSKEQVNQAVVHSREDIVLIVSKLNRTNILLRWIRFLFIVLIIVLMFKF
jgi:hypothetical protein